ncbi:60Kd inner membrane protein-domain-containing protein [Rhodofomes roseus]|uniref:60Kd inner membrane protein-domain-containing protein n=1 Tax=Rhodofomes roseus TaxID=34475 RepID=A0ABQ8KIH9_9APHY|nr:60Kd inner membrane protein-domain-containing protein [Rhodofomes roseus]KAH9837769.1 60Kd inner membrane protein-domain-containing protein [Rhodofomes roseus]
MVYVHRLGYLGSRVSLQAACHSQSRLTAPILLYRTRPLQSLRPSGLSHNARSYWWSSSPKAPQEPVVDKQLTAEEFAPEQPWALEQSPVDPVEGITAAVNAPVTGSELASVPTDIPVDISALVSTPPPPMQYGDLASLGLVGWMPAGFCRWGMEALHVSTGMPWFWTIVGATLITRVVLFPLTVKSMRSTAALAPHQEEISRLRQKMQLAQESKDMILLQQVALKQQSIYEKAGVSMASMALLPLVQLPITLGMFFGVKALCDLPVEQLKYSGLSYLPDLTVADPTGVLPIAAAVLVNLQLTLGAREMIASPQTAHLVNLFRVMSLVSIPLCWNLPTGTMVYIITSIIGLMGQSLVLRPTAIKRLLKIPIVKDQQQAKPATIMESIAFLKKWWQDKKREQEAAIRRRR